MLSESQRHGNPEDVKNIEWAGVSSRPAPVPAADVYQLPHGRGSGDRIQAAYGENLEKLAELKGKWDSANLFRQNKNIVPKTEAAGTA